MSSLLSRCLSESPFRFFFFFIHIRCFLCDSQSAIAQGLNPSDYVESFILFDLFSVANVNIYESIALHQGQDSYWFSAK